MGCRLGDSEVGFTEEDYIGLFDEAPIPKGQPPVVPKQPEAEPVAAASGDADDRPTKPTDFTGGMG